MMSYPMLFWQVLFFEVEVEVLLCTKEKPPMCMTDQLVILYFLYEKYTKYWIQPIIKSKQGKMRKGTTNQAPEL